MKQEKNRDQRLLLVNRITEMLMSQGFTFEYVVRKKPKGIRIIEEVSQEQMDAIIRKAAEKVKAVKDGKEEEIIRDDSL